MSEAQEPFLFPEGIDLIAYINLNIRTDRKEEIEKEFKRLEIPESKILRWTATRLPKNGPLGCTLSHIALLEHISTQPQEVQTILILEDDFNFVDDKSLVKNSLNKFLAFPRSSWDLGLLSYLISESLPYDDLMSISLFSQGTAGYLVNRSCIYKLIDNFKESRDKLQETNRIEYSLDIYWSHFMKASRKCFFFKSPLGYQRKSFSNIQGGISAYESYVKSERAKDGRKRLGPT